VKAVVMPAIFPLRFLSPLLALLAAGCASMTQAPSAAPVASPASAPALPPTPVVPRGTLEQNGALVAVKITGTATLSNEGETKALMIDMAIPPRSTLRTGRGSQLIVSFSNGTGIVLGAETELVVDEFRQEPFGGTIKIANLVEEPSPSRTRLNFVHGEVVVNVKKLKLDRGSTFVVVTPGGELESQGSNVFRLAYHPDQPGAGSEAVSVTVISGGALAGTGAGVSGTTLKLPVTKPRSAR
jgi:hypothetical protein